jgi:hypothetical protein
MLIRRVRAHIVLIPLMVLVAVSCWLFILARVSPMNEAEVPGTYRQEWSWGVETLTLEPDGTFIEEFRHPSGESFQSTGKWEMWKEPGGAVMVRVYGASIWPTERGGPLRLTYTFMASQSWRGKVLEKTPQADGAIRLARMP